MSFIRIVTRIISYIIPVSDKIYLFHSFPFYTENTYAIFRHISRDKGKRCIWVYDNDDLEMAPHNEKWPKERYKRLSIKGIWFFYRARYVFCSHGLNGFINIRQHNKIINLWHGMPLKTIGCLDPKSGGKNPTKADYLIATSPKFQQIMSRAFNKMPLDKVLLVGQPRNDLLFEHTDFYARTGINKYNYKRVGVWLPTYKQSSIGDVRCDGNFNDNGISFLTFRDIEKLNDVLSAIGDLLVIKLHPMDILQTKVSHTLRSS